MKTSQAEDLLQQRQEYLIPKDSHYYDNPPLLVKGSMQYLWDIQGKKYLDLFAGVVTVNAGHCHPEIAKRIKEQVDTLQHTTTLFLTEPIVRLAMKLAEIAPGNLKKSFITNSGTEANEGATVLAKAATGAHDFIALRHSFHGRTLMGMSLTGQSIWRKGGPYVYGAQFVSSAYCYRCPFGKTYPSCNLECAKDVENVIRTSTPGKIAGLIAEPIQGNGGVITPPPEYFKEVYAIVKKYGGLFISDEVQTGFGRTGEKWFGIEQWGVEPDIMTMAKGMGNGFPIGGFIAKPEIAEKLGQGYLFNTFGGNPVSATAALASIEVIEKEGLKENSAKIGKYFKERLLELQERHALIGDVRGIGLMLGVELVSDRKTKAPATAETKKLMEFCKDKGVIIGKGGLDGNVLRIKPPLCITKEDVDFAIKVLDEALRQV
jgi:4-aminobutyrate aminotransferase-like enzyme